MNFFNTYIYLIFNAILKCVFGFNIIYKFKVFVFNGRLSFLIKTKTLSYITF